MSKTSWIIFSVIIVLLFGGLIAWTRATNPPIDISGADGSKVISAEGANGNIGDHVKGKTDSTVVLVEYGDFQCPSCKAAHPNVAILMEEYGDRVAFVFRNFPLTSIHPNAKAAAGVAESAGLQGKYWEMYDILFENQNDWSSLDGTARNTIFNGYAQTLGLDSDRFTRDLAGSAVNRKISFDQALGKRDGVDATPIFFINGQRVDETAASSLVNGDLTAVKALLDQALAQ